MVLKLENLILGFIGAGNMAGAIMNGIISTHTYSAEKICVFDINAQKCDTFRKTGVTVADSSKDFGIPLKKFIINITLKIGTAPGKIKAQMLFNIFKFLTVK